MAEDMISSGDDREMWLPEQDEQLLLRQRQLQDEAQDVLEELNLATSLSKVGTFKQTGSSVLGLMVWRDLDLQVFSPGLSIEQAFDNLRPLLTHPRVKEVRYLQQSDHFRVNGLDERYFFMVFYERLEQPIWKLDISFWLREGAQPDRLHDAMEQQLTPENRLTILRIKDVWCQLPAYRRDVYSTDIYDAVLQHGVRTLAEFDRYLTQRGKLTPGQK